MPQRVNLKIAETAYKLEYLDEAESCLQFCEQHMKTDRHVIHLLKGKIYEKKHHYSWAVDEYAISLKLCRANRLPALILANVKSRLGWARIRDKRDVSQGIQEMRDANAIVPSNSDFAYKLALAIF